ncbi:sigma-70 family RNA polymerase sigma factor [Dehalobacter sp. 14DCB1]|uniref:sigma-70 family RNA polymerase sigma factor n=1 Tax=Dehalobacter sp. 14DCB1 TaxID=2070227 RepID=UPI001049E6DA|nr:sigma-70 family RNA polymerase sigma factor [Dehalobacter sp. 14DCB1]TCX53575.1 sigma-70 family RNA polymerase sigma factor [Dehalobacter sp. 14DCB1]
MDKKKKFCIRIGDTIQEVTEEVYREYFKMERRERYLEERDLVNGKVLYSELDNVHQGVLGEDILVDSIVEDICELVTTKIMVERLREYLVLLSDEELDLIIQLFFNEKSERELSAERGIPRKTISYRKDKILSKLKKYL